MGGAGAIQTTASVRLCFPLLFVDINRLIDIVERSSPPTMFIHVERALSEGEREEIPGLWYRLRLVVLR